MVREILTEWDGLMLTPEERGPMEAAYWNGTYEPSQIASAMKYPFSGMSWLFRDLHRGWLYYDYCDRDTAIALIRFILDSRRARQSRQQLKKQVRIENLTQELAVLREETTKQPSALAV